MYLAYLNSNKPDATDISGDHRSSGDAQPYHIRIFKHNFTLSPYNLYVILRKFASVLYGFPLQNTLHVCDNDSITMISIQLWRLIKKIVILYSALTTKTGILKFKWTKLPLRFSLNRVYHLTTELSSYFLGCSLLL